MESEGSVSLEALKTDAQKFCDRCDQITGGTAV
jgi:hypothetical protein